MSDIVLRIFEAKPKEWTTAKSSAASTQLVTCFDVKLLQWTLFALSSLSIRPMKNLRWEVMSRSDAKLASVNTTMRAESAYNGIKESACSGDGLAISMYLFNRVEEILSEFVICEQTAKSNVKSGRHTEALYICTACASRDKWRLIDFVQSYFCSLEICCRCERVRALSALDIILP